MEAAALREMTKWGGWCSLTALRECCRRWLAPAGWDHCPHCRSLIAGGTGRGRPR